MRSKNFKKRGGGMKFSERNRNRDNLRDERER